MKRKYLFKAFFCIMFLYSVMINAGANNSDNNLFALYCPDDVWVNCNDEIWDLSGYGNAYYWDYGQKHYVYNPRTTYHLGSCGTGYIRREFQAVDPYGRWHKCSQIVHVSGNNFSGNDIQWPEGNIDLVGCNPSTHPDDLEDGYPTWSDQGDCSLLGYTYNDQSFNFGPSCRKIVRTWNIFDWCNYNPNGYNSTGIWTYTQIIKISTGDTPSTTTLEDIVVTTPTCVSAWVEVSDPVISGESCEGAFEVSNNSEFAENAYINANGYYPIGTTNVTFTVEYGCGQIVRLNQKVIVESIAGPTPYCIYGVTTALMPIDEDGDGVAESGMVDIWAKDFDRGSYHTCGDQNIIASFNPEGTEMSRTFTCADLGINELQIYFIDSDGDYNSCIVLLEVQNNAANIQNCEAAEGEIDEDEIEDTEIDTTALSTLIGSVSYLDDSPNENANIKLNSKTIDLVETGVDTTIVETVLDSVVNQSGTTIFFVNIDTIIETKFDTLITEHLVQALSDENGNYNFSSVKMYEDYIINLDQARTDYSTVTADDAHAIYDHLIGVDPLVDPLQLLSADVDRNGQIDIEDFKLVVDVLLGLRDSYTENDQLIFVRSDYVFDAEINPLEDEQYMEYKIKNLDEENVSFDFITLRPGEVVGDNQAKSKRTQFVISKLSAEVFPNPFVSSINMNVFSNENSGLKYSLIDASAKVKMTQERNIQIGQNNIQITIGDRLNSGIYYLLLEANGERIIKKIVKE